MIPLQKYSDNFKFFLEHQIFISRTGNNYSFNSRVEQKRFYTTLVLEEMTEEQEKEICYKIFKELKL